MSGCPRRRKVDEEQQHKNKTKTWRLESELMPWREFLSLIIFVGHDWMDFCGSPTNIQRETEKQRGRGPVEGGSFNELLTQSKRYNRASAFP